MHLAIKTGKNLCGIVCAFMLFGLGLGVDRAFAARPPEVRAEVDRDAIDPSGTLVLSVSVESQEDLEVASPTLPPMSDFEVLSNWQGKEIRSTMVNTPTGPQFQTVHRNVFNWQLSPKRVGALTIFSVEVVVNGRSMRTKAISVRVASGLAQPKQRPQLPPGMEEDDEEDVFSQLLRRGMQAAPKGGSRTLPGNPNEAFFIQVETDKTEAYVGEQVTVSFFLYTTGMIRDLDTLKYPSLKGFWKEDIEIATHLNFQQEVIDGVPYKKALLASFALFPIKEGSATVDSYQAKCTVIPGGDPFGALGMGRAYTFTKTSAPVKIKVKAVPVEGRPDNFSGAVGDFQVTARVDDNSVVAGQPFPLKIRFEGRGNAKLIDIPPFQVPEGMELYDTQKEAKFFNWGTSFKEFTLQLIPRRDGEFVIPSVATSMFDPVSKKFVSRATEPLRVRVGASAAVAGQTSSQNFAKSGKAAKKLAPFEPKLIETFKPEVPQWTLAQAVAGAGGLYLFGLACLFGLAWLELGFGRGGPGLGGRLKIRIRELESASKKGEFRAVGVKGVNAIAFVLGEIVGDRVPDRETGKLIEALPPTLKREIGPELTRCLQTMEFLAFAPESVLGTSKDIASLKKVIDEMSNALQRVISLSGSVERSSAP